MNALNLTLIIWLLFFSLVYCQWADQNSGTDERLISVDFIDSGNGWIIPSPSQQNFLLKTSDGGENWHKIYNQYKFNSFEFLDINVGYAFEPTNGGMLFKTTDGGISWSHISSRIYFDNNGASFYVCDQNIWVVSDNYLYKTSDDGQSWGLFIFARTNPQDIREVISKIFFLNKNVGWTIFNNEVYSTKDGGITWTKVDLPKCLEIYFINEDIGWTLDNNRNMLKTEDGGKTWRYITTTSNYPNSISFLNDTLGFSIYGFLMKTSDSGVTWSHLPDSFRPIIDYAFVSEYEIWIVGDNGAIAKYQPDKTIKILSPNSDDKVYNDYKFTIKWIQTNLDSSKARIEYSTNSGNNWIKIIDSVSISALSYEWSTKDLPVTSCLIKMTELVSGLITISELFEIIKEERQLKLIYPSGDEHFIGENIINVIWEANYENPHISGIYSVYDDTSSIPVYNYPTYNFNNTLEIRNYTGFAKFYIYDYLSPQIYCESGYFKTTWKPETMGTSYVSSLKLNNTYKIVIEDNLAYITARQYGFYIVDISDPHNPELISRYQTEGWAYGICYKDEKLYIAEGTAGLSIYDISDPLDIFCVGKFDLYQAYDVVLMDSVAFVSDIYYGLRILNVINPSEISEISKLSNTSRITLTAAYPFIYGVGGDISYEGIYTTEGGIKLDLIDVSDLSAPKIISNIIMPGNSRILSVAVKSDILLAGCKGRIVSYNISDKNNPREITSFSDGYFRDYTSVIIDPDNKVFASNYLSGLEIFSNITTDEIMRNGYFYPNRVGGLFQDLEKKDSLVFLVANKFGLYIINIEEKTVGFKDDFNYNQLNFSLSQNFPNPFNPVTKIEYSIPKTSLVTLKVYDILGREIAVLVNEDRHAGNYSVVFDGSNLSSGIYIYTLKSSSYISTKKMIIMK